MPGRLQASIAEHTHRHEGVGRVGVRHLPIRKRTSIGRQSGARHLDNRTRRHPPALRNRIASQHAPHHQSEGPLDRPGSWWLERSEAVRRLREPTPRNTTPMTAIVTGRGSEVATTVMTAIATISAPTIIITTPCVTADPIMDSLCHCAAPRTRDRRPHRAPMSRRAGVRGRLYAQGRHGWWRRIRLPGCSATPTKGS